MAPTVGHLHYPKENLTSSHKLRKPMVEKLRRDRINTSIEQLKALLGPEFLRQQPDSKQEKADILEMAVSYLKVWQLQPSKRRHAQQQQPPPPPQPPPQEAEARGDGYARCVQEAVSFLSESRSDGRLLDHFLGLQAASGQAASRVVSPPGSPLHQTAGTGTAAAAKDGGRSALWRPW
ncbi:unnamed protein product [Merluccius merluccius]